MRTALATIASIALLGFATAAHASPILAGTYSLNDAYADGFAITGTITLNSTGVVTNASDTLVWNGMTFSSLNGGGLYGTSPNWSQDYISGSYGEIQLEFSITPTGLVDLTVCTSTDDTSCTANGSTAYSTIIGYNGHSSYNLTSGPTNTGTQAYLAFVPTPEPSSLMLLGTGVMGVAGVLRRRLRKA